MDRIYVRGSDDRINPENQLQDLRRCTHAAVVYTDTMSGAKNRPELERLIAECQPGDVVWIWSLDRLSRQGIAATLGYLQQLTERGARVRSHQEGWLDSSSPAYELLVACMAWAGKFERDRLVERTRTAIRNKRAAAGRPVLDKEAIGRAPGSLTTVAKQYGCCKTYVVKCRASVKPAVPSAAPSEQAAAQPARYFDRHLGMWVSSPPAE